MILCSLLEECVISGRPQKSLALTLGFRVRIALDVRRTLSGDRTMDYVNVTLYFVDRPGIVV